MVPPISSRWTTDPEYIDLLNFLVERTKNVKSPMSIKRMAREFKMKNGAAITQKSLANRAYEVREVIHSFEHIDTNTKVKMLFALSVSVNPEFLITMKKNAIVEVDEKNRITHYKANNGSLELAGDHNQSAKIRTYALESKQSILSWIIDYFENNNNSNAIPANVEEEEMWNLIEFITEKCENVDSPLSITRLAEDFVDKFQPSVTSVTVLKRIRAYCQEIQKMEFVNTGFKIQQLFGLSATVDSDYLEKLRTNALVKVDEKNRITYYKANDGSLELGGDHSRFAKISTGQLDSKRILRSMIKNYFKRNNDADKGLHFTSSLGISWKFVS